MARGNTEHLKSCSTIMQKPHDAWTLERHYTAKLA